MKHMRFDDYVKEQFRDYSPDVPPHLWDKIAATREKKKPGGFWYFLNNRVALLFIGLLLLSGGAAWYFSTLDNNSDTAKNKTVPAASQQNSNSVDEENKSINGNDPADPSATVNRQGNDPLDQNKIVTNSGDPSNGNNNVSSPLNASLRQHPASRIGANDDYSWKLGVITPEDNKQQKPAANDDVDDNDPNALPSTGTLMARLLYGAEKIGYTRKGPLSFFGEERGKTKPPKCPRINNLAGDEQYVEIYGGPDFVMRSITDSSNTAYLQKRKETEKFSSAYSAGLRYTRVFNNAVSLRTGVNYSQVNEKFTYQKGGIIQYVYIIDQATGDTIGSYSLTGTRYKTSYNRYRTVDIPLQVGYEMGSGRLHANVSAGAMINVYSWQKGDVLDTAFNPVSITTGKNSSPYGFKTNVGLGFIASASLYYKLTRNTGDDQQRLVDRMHLVAEPYFRYSFKPMSKEALTLSQKYNTAGLRLGIRIDIK